MDGSSVAEESLTLLFQRVSTLFVLGSTGDQGVALKKTVAGNAKFRSGR